MMKKLLAILLALCVLLAAFSALAEGAPTIGGADPATQETYSGNPYAIAINDEGGLLTEKEKADVLEMMNAVSKYANVGFLTKPTGGRTENSAVKARNWGDEIFGSDERFVVFIIDMTLRHLDLYVSKPLAGVLTSRILNSIVDNTYRYASRGEYAACVVETFRLIENVLIDEQPAENVFVFRDKIRWGMKMAEVAEVEGPAEAEKDVGDYTILGYTNVSISNYQGYLAYIFYYDSLISCVYGLNDECGQETYDYLKKALSAVYGSGNETSFETLHQYYSSVIPDAFDNSGYSKVSTWCWEGAGNTEIFLDFEGNSLYVYYVSPVLVGLSTEKNNEEKTEEVNITGL